MASPVCSVTDSAPTRLLRLGCNTVALGASVLLVLATAFTTYFATRATQASVDAMLILATAALLLLNLCSIQNASRWRIPALLAGILTFVALAFSGLGHTTDHIDGRMPMAGLIALSMITTQISANLTRSTACSCD